MLDALTHKTHHFAMVAAEKAGGYDGAPAETGAFPPFDPTWFPSQLFWFFLSFFVLYFLLSKVFLPRVGETIEERGARIADDLDQASRMQREAEEAEIAYNQSLADARAKAMNVAETTKQSVDAEVQAELASADAEADKTAEIAEGRIRDLRAAALGNIETVAAEAAQTAVEALTGKKVTLATVKAALN
jgi:F-type H+-transporting ATPase subunit b